jgi:hypothetical protein
MSTSLRTQILEALEMSYEQQLTGSDFGGLAAALFARTVLFFCSGRETHQNRHSLQCVISARHEHRDFPQNHLHPQHCRNVQSFTSM